MKRIVILSLVAFFISIYGCRMDVNVSTPPVNEDIPITGNSTGAATFEIYGETASSIPDEAKSVEIKDMTFSMDITNNTTYDVDVKIIISLYGQAKEDELVTYGEVSGSGTISYSSVPDYLDAQYQDNVQYVNGNKYGWTYLVNTTIPAGGTIHKEGDLSNVILNEMFNQDMVWVIGGNTITTNTITILSGTISIKNLIITVDASKDLGFFPSLVGGF